jgi:hypothetical protein
MPYGSALHEYDRMMAIFPFHGRRKSYEITCLRCARYLFKNLPADSGLPLITAVRLIATFAAFATLKSPGIYILPAAKKRVEETNFVVLI